MWNRSRREKNKGEEAMYNWPYPPMMYPMPMGGQQPTSKVEYVKYLKKELKLIKTKDGGKKTEEKKIWWKRFEVGAALFMFSPIIAAAWIGVLKLSWIAIMTLVH